MTKPNRKHQPNKKHQPTTRPTPAPVIELTDTTLQQVTGGLNPQPLPPKGPEGKEIIWREPSAARRSRQEQPCLLRPGCIPVSLREQEPPMKKRHPYKQQQQPKELVELTDKDLEWVQGGSQGLTARSIGETETAIQQT